VRSAPRRATDSNPQIAMFPNMLNNTVEDLIDQHRDRPLGWKLTGTGGGYLVLVSDKPILRAIRIKARRA